MEYVDGPSLEAVLKREKSLPVGRAAALLAPVARAFAHVHEAGIVYRDVEPSTILLTSSNVPNVSNLCLVKATAAATTSFGQVTTSDRVLGAVFHMAPEQANAPETVDGRSDIYALGCTLYQMRTGNPPFVRDSPLKVLRQHDSAGAAGDLQSIVLPKPQTEGGQSVLAARKERRPIRRIKEDHLPPPVLSNLLWAAFGINRQEQGPFGRLGRTAASASNSQEIDRYVALPGNVSLFSASQGLAAWLHNGDKPGLTKALHLRPQQRILYAQTVGYAV